jgi:hypothetical protein
VILTFEGWDGDLVLSGFLKGRWGGGVVGEGGRIGLLSRITFYRVWSLYLAFGELDEAVQIGYLERYARYLKNTLLSDPFHIISTCRALYICSTTSHDT